MSDPSSEAALQEDTEIKVRLPVGHQLILHQLKVVGDKTISTIVEEALHRHFEHLADAEDLPIALEELREGSVRGDAVDRSSNGRG